MKKFLLHFVILIVTSINKRIKHRLAWLNHYQDKICLQKTMLKFGERSDDIYIVTYPRSGTTWMQMLLYQLTTDGNMNFKHLYDVSPWPYATYCNNWPIPDLASPRIIKSHERYDEIPRQRLGRFIFIYRDGKDAITSHYQQLKDYHYITYTFSDYFQDYVLKKNPRNWFEFTRQWLENKQDRNILYISYEEMKINLPAVARKVINFIKIDVTESKLAATLERCDFNFMKMHEKKFGEQPISGATSPKVYNQFIRHGEIGKGIAYMNEEQINSFNQRMKEIDKLVKEKYKY